MTSQPVLIEGYAALFGVADLSGDVVRAGAFAQSLKTGPVPMLFSTGLACVLGTGRGLSKTGEGCLRVD